ncbi:hypothetical protein [Pseudonocardia adelaidensis]|uniref:Acetyl-CoA acetyltransferase n=1 Tax=Pseudonocardia adelaidensis TaxID=648754 RepID=A0ABP9NBX1_9PSEU
MDPDTPHVAVLAVHTDVVEREEHRSLEEMIFQASRAVLERAGLDRCALDGVVLSGNDQVDGRVISCMPSAGPAGGVGLDVTMIASSGEHALVYGYLRLLSGQGRTVLVVGWGKPSESVHPDFAELVSAEPYVLRAVGMNDTLAAALQASTWITDGGPSGDDVVSWPLTRDDLPARCDGVYAAVLAVEGSFEPGRELAWVHDAGWSTDRYEMGARDLRVQTALAGAREQVTATGCGPAGWTSVEIAGPSEPAVVAATATLGLADGAAVNASGSLASAPAPAHVAGLARMLAAAGSVARREADTGPPAVAAGIGLNGFAGQGATVMVFGEERKA